MNDKISKSWKNEGRYPTYESVLSKLVSFTGEGTVRETDTHLYKIKFMNSDKHYVLKSWTKPPKQETKKTKNSRGKRNKRAGNNKS